MCSLTFNTQLIMYDIDPVEIISRTSMIKQTPRITYIIYRQIYLFRDYLIQI